MNSLLTAVFEFLSDLLLFRYLRHQRGRTERDLGEDAGHLVRFHVIDGIVAAVLGVLVYALLVTGMDLSDKVGVVGAVVAVIGYLIWRYEKMVNR